MEASRRAYLPGLDGLRAIAVVGVLFFHADHLIGGFLGVDAFFVISGFLITRQMLIEVERTERISLAQFWARRARRLLPALILLLVVVIAVAHQYGYASERLKIREDAPWSLAFALNWRHITADADYWASLSSPSPLTHLWSLAVEEQFYLLWPLVMVLLIRRGGRELRARERTVLIGSAIGAALSFALMAIVYEPARSTRAYEGTDTRIGALLVGALCATTIATATADRAFARLGRWRWLMLYGPVAVLAWMWLRVDGRDDWLYHGGFLLHAGLFAIILLGVSSGSATTAGVAGALPRLLALRPVRWFGQLSYGLYLWHWPIYIALSPERVDLSRWPLTAVRLVATVAAASISYYAVERPVRQGLQRRPVGRTATLGLVGIAVAAAVIVVVPQPSSGPAPINIESLTPAGAVPPVTTAQPIDTSGPVSTQPVTAPPSESTGPVSSGPTLTDAGAGTTTVVAPAATTTTTTAATTTTTPTTTPTATTIALTELHRVLWLGDSIAFTTAPGIVAAMGAIGIDVYDGSFPGVGMLNETGDDLFAQVIERLASEQPDLVIFEMSTWDEPFGADAIHGALIRLRDLAINAGAQLLLLPVPPLRSDQDHDGFPSNTAAAQRLAAEDPAHVSFLPTTDVWGTSFDYDLDDDRIPERLGDGVHLCPSGSARFAIWLINQLSTRYSNLFVADPATWALGEWTQDSRYDRVAGGCSLLP